MRLNFWLGGRGEYLKALEEDERQLLEPLLKRHPQNEEEKIRIEDQVQKIRSEFEAKRVQARGSLFSR